MKGFLFKFLCYALLIHGIFQVFPQSSYSLQDEIRLFIPAFEGQGSLGKNVATVLNLQIWQTLRSAPYPNPENLYFGKGKIMWDTSPLAVQSHLESEKAAMDFEIWAQFVLWGTAFEYGTGVVVQAYLSIPEYEDFREAHHEVWEVRIPGPQRDILISIKNSGIGIPQRRYEFSPIILDADIVSQYTLPNSFKLYSLKKGGRQIGSLADEYIGIQMEGDHALVLSLPDKKKGWIYLPKLSKNRSELVDFVGGLIRMFRNDLKGAIFLLQQVVENRNVSINLKVDSYLYLAMAKEKLGLDGSGYIKKAYDLNPYYQPTITFAIMGKLSRIGRIIVNTGDIEQKRKVIQDIESLIDSHKYLFIKNSPWIKEVMAVLESLKTPR
jgi:hypothetical protein